MSAEPDLPWCKRHADEAAQWLRQQADRWGVKATTAAEVETRDPGRFLRSLGSSQEDVLAAAEDEDEDGEPGSEDGIEDTDPIELETTLAEAGELVAGLMQVERLLRAFAEAAPDKPAGKANGRRKR